LDFSTSLHFKHSPTTRMPHQIMEIFFKVIPNLISTSSQTLSHALSPHSQTHPQANMNSECQGDTLTIRKLKESVSTTNLHDQIRVLYCTLSWKMPIEITICTRPSCLNATKRESCPRKSSPQEVRLKYFNTQISNTGCVHHFL
jgi:hypothetical protein